MSHGVLRRTCAAFAMLAILTASKLATAQSAGDGNTGPDSTPTARREFDREFNAKADRLRRAVYRQPRAGVTFDLWVQHYQAVDALDAWRDSILTYRDEHPQDAAAHLVAGLAYSRADDWQMAAQEFQIAARLAPDDYYPLSQLADVQLRTGQTNEAVASLAAALSKSVPRNEIYALNRQLAQLYAQSGQNAQAADVWLRLAQQFPRDDRITTEAARQLQKLGATDEARKLWQGLVQRVSTAEQRYDAQLQLAQLEASAGEFETALESYTRLFDQVQPDSWRGETLALEANKVLSSMERPTERSIAFWQARHEANPQSVTFVLEWVESQLRAGRTDEALQQLQAAVNRAPTVESLRRRLIDVLLLQNQIAAACAEAERWAQNRPTDPQVWIELGQLRLQQPATDRATAQEAALRAWQRAVATRPQDADLALQVAEAARSAAVGALSEELSLRPQMTIPQAIVTRESKCLEAALGFYRLAVERSPTFEYEEYLGEFLHRLGRADEAIATWRSLGRDDETGLSQLEVAQVLRRCGYTQAAEEEVAAAIARDPQLVRAWDLWIDLLDSRAAFDEALDVIRRYAAAQPDDRDWQRAATRRRIQVLADAGRLDAEIQRQQTILAQNPNDALATWTLAQIWSMRGNRDESLAALTQLAAQSPDDVQLARELAQAFDRSKKLDAAVAQYQHVIDLQVRATPDDHRRLIELLTTQQRWSEAVVAADRFAAQMPRQAEPWLLKAAIAAGQGNSTDRIAALRQAVRLQPNDVQVHREMAEALRELERDAEAFQQAMDALAATASLTEKQAVVGWILSWPPTDEQQQQLSRWLDQRRAQETATSDEWTRCLVQLYQETGQSAAALRELADLRSRYPTDLNLLQQLVDLAFVTSRLDEAVVYQRQLVNLANDPSEIERLARLYRQKGDTEEAQKIWDQLIDRVQTESETLRMVDDLLLDQDLFRAQQLVESALSRQPTSPPLLLQAARIHLALEQYDEAHQTLLELVRLPADDAKRVADLSPAEALQLFVMGLEVDRHVWQLATRRLQYGLRHRNTLQHLFEDEHARAVAGASQTRLQVDAALLALRMTEGRAGGKGAQGNRPLWLADAPRVVQQIVQWVAGREESLNETHTAPDAVATLPNSLDAWSAMLTPPRSGESAVAYQQRLETGFRELTSRDTQLQSSLLSVYAAMLVLLPDDASFAEIIDEALERPTALSEMLAWAPRLTTLPPALRAKVLPTYVDRVAERWNEGEDTAASMIAAQTAFLYRLASWNEIPPALRRERLAQLLTTTIVQQAVHGSEPDELQRGRRAWPLSPLEEALALNWQARVEWQRATTRAPGSQEIQDERTMDAQVMAARLAALQSDWFDRVAVDGKLMPRPVVLSGVANPQRLFPVSSAWLSDEMIALIELTAETAVNDADRQSLVRDWRAAESQRLNERGLASDDAPSSRPPTSIALELARHTLTWFLEGPSAAVDGIEQLVASISDERRGADLLLRAYLDAGRLSRASQYLRGLPDAVRGDAGIAALERTLGQRWTTKFADGQLDAHDGAVTCMAVSYDGRWLATGGVDGLVVVWNMETRTIAHRFEDHEDIVLAVAFSPSGYELASAGYDRGIRRYQLDQANADPRRLPVLEGHQSAVRTLRYSSDGKLLGSGGDDRQAIIWNRETGEPRFRVTQAGPVYVVGINSAANQLVTSGADRTLYAWSLTTGELVAKCSVEGGEYRALVQLPSASGEGSSWLAAGELRRLDRWDAAFNRSSTPTVTMSLPAFVRTLAWVPKRHVVLAGSDDQQIRFCDTKSNEIVLKLPAHGGRILALAVDPNERWFVSSALDGTVKTWSFPTLDAE